MRQMDNLARVYEAGETETGLLPREVAAAGVTAWCRPPRIQSADALLFPLGQEAAEAGALLWLEGRRHGVATLLTLAVKRGWVDEAEIGKALDGSTVGTSLYRLVERALGALATWMNETGLRWSGLTPADVENWVSFASLDVSPCEAFERGNCGCGHPHDTLIVEGTATADRNYASLHQCPPELASVAFRAIELLRVCAVDSMAGSDVVEVFGPYAEGMEVYQAMLKAGAGEDPDKMVAYLRTDDAFQAYWGHADRGDILSWVEELREMDAPEPAWQRMDWERERVDLAADLTRTIWERRRTRPDLYRDPWTRFAVAAARAVRRWLRNPNADRCGDCGLADEEVWLAQLQVVYFGEKYVGRLLDDMRECMCQGSEIPMRRLPMNETDPEALVRRLGFFAVGFGLLCRADRIEEGFHGG
jgi:hypothetical protein